MFEAKQPAQTRAVYGNHITAWDKRIHFVHRVAKARRAPAFSSVVADRLTTACPFFARVVTGRCPYQLLKGTMMKFFVEIDLERGNGAVRWERVTPRNVRRLMIGLGSSAAAVIAIATWLFNQG
jgi:hypothetical protein